MPELLKNKYHKKYLHELALRIKTVYPAFQGNDFVDSIMDETWDTLELKARIRQIAINLGRYLPTDYEQALGVIDRFIASYPTGFNDFTLMYFPDFVEVYGQDLCHWDLSIAALERYTASSSSEFAVRPFIINHQERMMRQMAVWARHDNEHVRRLASEGCRPALPWGQALTCFKKDPSPVLEILEQLKADPSLYVRKSVANNLNDISKTHPSLVTKLAENWYGENEHTNWIVKHGCRTLLKNGNQNVLTLFGYDTSVSVDVQDFALEAASILIGDNLSFSFAISTKEAVKVRLEYGIDYVKSNGTRKRKIFKISEVSLKPNEKKLYTKKHSFADVSVRKHYPGLHSLTLIVNSIERGTLDFQVG